MLKYENIHPDLTGYFDTLIRTVCAEDYSLHLHKCFEFICIMSGKGKVEIDGTVYDMAEGDAALVLPSEAHTLFSDTECFAFVTIFSTTFVPLFYDEVKNKSAKNPIFHFEEYELFNELQNKSADRYLLCSIFYKLAYYFKKNTEFINKNNKSTFYVNSILDYIENNFNQDISLYTLSKQLNFSYHYTSNLFAEIFRTNFLDLVNQYRIHHADELVRETDLPIEEIADRSGYKNIRSLMRNFSKYIGKTPAQIRSGQII